MSDLDDQARALLHRAATLCRTGWCRGRGAENGDGQALTVVAGPPPPNATAIEIQLSPTRFDVSGAMFRAIASRRIPKGRSKEETRLLYFSVDANGSAVLERAKTLFCLAARTLHPSIWNDTACKSGEQAAEMLELAACPVR